MLQWFQANLGTICIGALLAGVLALIVRHLLRQKKQHKCACGRSNCPNSAICCGASKAQKTPQKP